MRLLRCLLVSGSAALMAGTLTLTAGSAVTTAAGPARAVQSASHHPSARFLAEARRALAKYLRHDHAPAELAHPGKVKAGPRNTKSVESYNWSGYADVSTTDGAFTKVSGRWTTPAVKCTAEDTITSEWVGIDGFSSDTVEQDGTISWCFEGTPTYFTWYEMFPAGTVEVGTSLQPGDQITASVSRSGTSYTLALTDSTNRANSFSINATCAAATCVDTSAEWISERPSFAIGISPLADYGSWQLTDGMETASGTSGTIGTFVPNYKINMIDATQSYLLSTSTALSHGTIFSTTWDNSY
jgi:Peptidase A4 family